MGNPGLAFMLGKSIIPSQPASMGQSEKGKRKTLALSSVAWVI